MDPEAREAMRRTIADAFELTPKPGGEKGPEIQDASESSSPSPSECKITLAEELGRLAADLFAEGKL